MSKQYRRCWTYPDEKGNVRVERSEGIPQFIKDIAEHIEWIEIDAITAAEKTIAEKDARIKELHEAIDAGIRTENEMENQIERLKVANSELEQQLKEAESVIGFYADRDNWLTDIGQRVFDTISFDNDKVYPSENENECEYYGGKLAREYLAKRNSEEKEK